MSEATMRWSGALAVALLVAGRRAAAEEAAALPAPPPPSAEATPGGAPPVSPPPSPEAAAVAPAPVEATVPPVMPAFSAPPPAPPRAAEKPAGPRPADRGLGVELGAGLVGAARFPVSSPGREVEEAVDGGFGLGGLFGSRTAVIGLLLERTGLGKDHYQTSSSGETRNASYLADTLSVVSRWYFTDERPAFYLSLAAGPALPRVRATGTRASSEALVVPPVPYSCSEAGRVGASIAAAAGGEFAVADDWSLLGEARLSGLFASGASGAFGGCAPATGDAVSGTLRLAVGYWFGR